MSEELMIREASPTLAGIKTGSLFTCPYESKEQVMDEIREMNRCLVKKGLCLLPFRFSEKRVLLYLFRPLRLEQDLTDEDAKQILKEAGYHQHGFRRCLTELVRRVNQAGCSDFPHEIGLFLSYPPEDVRGFIEHHAEGSKLTGCWKVYGDVNAAQKRFEAYEKCTASYRRALADGKTVLQLAVAG